MQDLSKITNDLGWRPRESFQSGLRKAVVPYLANRPCWKGTVSEIYRGARFGVVA
jgi:dTDP-glucose 4,6-dehydratase